MITSLRGTNEIAAVQRRIQNRRVRRHDLIQDPVVLRRVALVDARNERDVVQRIVGIG